MKWLQDKKNLPIVIGLVAVIVIAAVVFVFVMKGSSGGDVATAPTDPMAMPGGPGMPGGPPGAPGAPGMPPGPGGPSGAPMPAAGPTPAPGAPGPAAPGAPGAPAPGGAAAAPAAGTTTEVALKPTPLERWRDDPFAPVTSKKPGPKVKLQPRLLDFPMLARVFPPPPPPIDKIEQLLPQPPRRVAGILYSDRVNALIQTPDGWETVKPGDRLRDGTLVERIERDRVVLRTVDDRPRLIEVKLAATVTPLQEKQNTPAGAPGRGAFPGGPPMPGMGPYGPPERAM